MDYELVSYREGCGFDIVPCNADFNKIGFHIFHSIPTLEDNSPANCATIIKKRSFHGSSTDWTESPEIFKEQDMVLVPSNIDNCAVAYHLAKRYAEVHNLNIKDCTKYTPVNDLGKLTEKLDKLIF